MRSNQEKNQPKGNRPPLKTRLSEALGFPADAFGSGFTAELRGREELTVSGCRRIIDYSPERICLCTTEGELVILGEALSCVTYCAGVIGITGRIAAFSFGPLRAESEGI